MPGGAQVVGTSVDRFVATREFGGVRASVIAIGSFRMAPRPFPAGPAFPGTEVDAEKTLRAGLCCLYLEVGGARIVVDPAAFVPGEPTMLDDLRLTPGLDAALQALGADPLAVDHVVLTHGHFDHCCGVLRREPGGATSLRFPNATHLVRVEDWHADGGLAPDWHADVVRYLQPVHDAGRLDVVDAAERVVVDGVTLVAAPGETPGHAVVRIEAGGERFYHLGDLIHLPGEAGQVDWAAGAHQRDERDMAASRRRFLGEVAAGGSLAMFTHGHFPAWGRLAAAGPDAWHWEYEHSPTPIPQGKDDS